MLIYPKKWSERTLDADVVWQSSKEVCYLYRWALHKLEHDTQGGLYIGGGNHFDFNILLENTTIEESSAMYAEGVFQMCVRPKRRRNESLEKIEIAFENCKSDIEQYIRLRVLFGRCLFGFHWFDKCVDFSKDPNWREPAMSIYDRLDNESFVEFQQRVLANWLL